MLKKLSERIGFTQTEIKVTAFLLIVLIIGFTYKTFFKQQADGNYREFNYTKEDSTFLNSGAEADSTDINLESKDDGLKSKEDILELNNKDLKSFSPKTLPSEKSINLNKADIKSLTNLPGIGGKTAEKIVALRIQLGKFKNFDQLLLVKGIGNSKLAKIKKYSYIE